jgi:hypothetical protein
MYELDSGKSIVAMWDPSLSGTRFPGLVTKINLSTEQGFPYNENIWPHTSIRTSNSLSASDALELNKLGQKQMTAMNDGVNSNISLLSYIYGIRPRGNDPIYLNNAYEGTSGSMANWLAAANMDNSRCFWLPATGVNAHLRCQVSWNFNGYSTSVNSSSNANKVLFGVARSARTNIASLAEAAALSFSDFQFNARGWPYTCPMSMFSNGVTSTAQNGYAHGGTAIRAINAWDNIAKTDSVVFMPVIIVSESANGWDFGVDVLNAGYSLTVQFCFQFSLAT